MLGITGRSLLLLLAPVCAAIFALDARADEEPLRVFIRAGVKTHGPGEHDHPRFLAEWTALLTERGAIAEGALTFPSAEQLERADVLVLFAAEAGSIHGAERARLAAFTARGGGIVVLHDALTGDDPEWFASVVGGAWRHGTARWQEGRTGVYFTDIQHPITAGAQNFEFDDEIYYELDMHPDAVVLAHGFHSVFAITPQMWTFEPMGPEGYRAFVSIPGHQHANFAHPSYRTLVLRGIAWAGGRDADLLVTPDEIAGLPYPMGGPVPPEDAHESFELHEDFTIELVAAEPLVVNPVSLDWDARGRMWVALTPGYPEKAEFSSIPAHDEIAILVDEDGDGRMDTKRVFADGLDLVTSFVFHKDGVIVAQAPDILWLRDTDGDDVADRREVLYTGFGYRDTHAVMSNLRWGLDGWIYGTQGYSGAGSVNVRGVDEFGKIPAGVFRFQPDGTAIEHIASFGDNSWGLDFAPDGELFFTQANGSHLRHLVMTEGELAGSRVGGVRSWLDITDHERAFPSRFHERSTYVQIDFAGGFTAAAGCLLYDGGAWPNQYRDYHFVSEPTLHLVHRDIVKQSGVTFYATKPRQQEFLTSSDLWFRPIHARAGPDGALYLLDFYNQAIVHNDPRGPEHGPTNAARRPDRDHGHGRIWRIQHKRAKERAEPELATLEPPGLIAALESPNGWRRGTAQRLLCERPSEAVRALLVTFALHARKPQAEIHALWTLARTGLVDEGLLVEAMRDRKASVRKNGARLAGLRAMDRYLAVVPVWSGTRAHGELLRLLDDRDVRVRLLTIIALAAYPVPEFAAERLVRLWSRAEENWTRSAILRLGTFQPEVFARAALVPAGSQEFVEALFGAVGRQRIEERAVALVRIVAVAVDAPPALRKAALTRLAAQLGGFDAPPSLMPGPAGALVRLVQSEDVGVAVAALPFAQRWPAGEVLTHELVSLAGRLFEQLEDVEQPDDVRIESLVALLASTGGQRAVHASEDMLQPWHSPDVQERVIDALGDSGNAAVAEVLTYSWTGLGERARERAFDRLMRRPEWTAAVLDRLASEEWSLRDLGPHRVFRLRHHPDADIARRANEVLDRIAGSPDEAKAAIVARLLPIVTSPADVRHGAELFRTNCATCHSYEGEGANVGPDLTGIGAHGVETLLPILIDPSREVDAAYVEYVAQTVDGETFGGVLVREGRDSIVLRNTSGDHEVLRVDLEVLQSTGRSPMPTGFEELGAEALRDILGYLCAGSAGFRLLDLDGLCSANTEQGMYDPVKDPYPLLFARYGVVEVSGVPFEILDPSRTKNGANALVLQGGMNRGWQCREDAPQRVDVRVGFAMRKLHVLGGIAGWGYPFTQEQAGAVKVTWKYADGVTAETTLRDGEEFADWVRRIDVPGSQFAEGVLAQGSRRNVRTFALESPREGVVESIALESYVNHLAPTFIALTAQLGDDAPEAEAAPIEARTAAARVLLVGGGSSHDFAKWVGGTDTRILAPVVDGPVRYTEDPAAILPALDGLAVLFLTGNRPLAGDALQQGIFDFVGRGGGLFVGHAAGWYGWDWPAYYRELVGGGSRSHEALGAFDVTVHADHAVTEGLPAAFIIIDELYRFERDPEGAPIEVLATGHSRTSGASFPVLWVVESPGGRVVCTTLGHDGRAHQHPAYVTLIRNSVRWLSER